MQNLTSAAMVCQAHLWSDVQDNTIADSPMVELLTSMQHMLEQARVRTLGVGSPHDLHQLVIIVADGRFHEKESLQRVVAVSHPTGNQPSCNILFSPVYLVQVMQPARHANFWRKAESLVCIACHRSTRMLPVVALYCCQLYS